MGGNVSNFARIFGEKSASGYALTECANGVFSRCADMITGVIDYAKDTQNGFPASIENFSKPDKLQIYQYAEKYYKDIGVHAEPLILPDSVIPDKEFLVTTITHDRRMLEYLKAYQQQSMMVNIDALTQDWLKKATENYQALIDEYDNYDIVDACYGDTNNIAERCHSAVSQVKAMHSRYQKYIDSSEKLATVVAEYHPYGTFKYIPNTIGSGCIKDGSSDNMNCTGTFAQYSDGNTHWTEKHVFNDYVQCVIDTTSDSAYFKNAYPSQTNKILICWDHDKGAWADHFHWDNYIRKVANHPSNMGRTGYWTANTGNFSSESDLEADASGINDRFVFSDSSDFLYNPI